MKKKHTGGEVQQPQVHGVIEGAGSIVKQQITETLETNYMPYAISVIMSRAIPEIDGFKPSHRKLLYTMYKMGLLGPTRTKSSNIVGQTMKLNPHGESAIYDTLVRLSRGYEALLHPFVDSKGNFGKFYSRDMACAASRYTEAKLDPISQELFKDIEKDTVDFVDNYDNTTKEPTLFPVTFPTILVNANTGIAVGMASSICSFNLAEVCRTTIEYMKNPEHDILSTLPAPDFPGGGLIIYDRKEFEKVYRTGRGSMRVRSRYSYDKEANCIDITQIPPTTTIEAIIEKTVDLVKQGKIKEISDIRDETGLEGLKITIDLKRGTDPDRLMAKLFRMTPLEDSFSCNFNVLVKSAPRVMGIREILDEWIHFRTECVRRRTQFELKSLQDKLHLLKGLQAILVDIDKAIAIIRQTDEESEVVPNLMIGFGIDQPQAEYVAEIKLRHLNREYILKRTAETEQIEHDIAALQKILESDREIRKVILAELDEVARKYGQKRRSMIIYEDELQNVPEEEVQDYAVNLFFTKEGYFKKITPLSLRMSGEQKLKEGDSILQQIESVNSADLLFFTNRCTVYKAKASDFSDTKASVLGDYLPAQLGMEEGEVPIYMAVTTDYKGYMLFFFENGKVAKVDLASYQTKTNRKKLVNAYSDKSPVVACAQIEEDCEFLLTSSKGKVLLIHSGAIASKSTRSTQGVSAMTLKRGAVLSKAQKYEEGMLTKPDRYRKKIPSSGTVLSEEEQGEQLTLS
ncbi:MAG: DNA topoisomerase (ATP-hydrolyzing) [Thermocaproicibacter melissae]|jgi:DNA gyrase subunit A|uniref:DNA gyrase/topoisomerase IV subunit A n=1 Tax=Thermocaproicibacter melissae TaxID=2966552 RepID=UPI0024B249CE|nr:DNA topoisomerase (ATP-hydrolyzing) subunit A [Thermocaproicibacter melissae]WBY64878.1 DNA topoisomerase (ATP-hydrolyzing) subunit A [Thermocaproicibacter melissae]